MSSSSMREQNALECIWPIMPVIFFKNFKKLFFDSAILPFDETISLDTINTASNKHVIIYKIVTVVEPRTIKNL